MNMKFSSLVGWLMTPPKRSATRSEKFAAKLVLSVCDLALKGAVAVTTPAAASGVAKQVTTTPRLKSQPRPPRTTCSSSASGSSLRASA